jgi:hypothetical protein
MTAEEQRAEFERRMQLWDQYREGTVRAQGLVRGFLWGVGATVAFWAVFIWSAPY